jgi:hypothetical protein
METSFSEIERIKELAGIAGEESSKIVINVPENTSYKDFAIAVADVLKEGYGTHNFKPFVQALVDALKDKD